MQKLTAAPQPGGGQQPVSHLPHVETVPLPASPSSVRTSCLCPFQTHYSLWCGTLSCHALSCASSAQHRLCCQSDVVKCMSNICAVSYVLYLHARDAEQADQPSPAAGAVAGQKRTALEANLLPDPRLLQRPRTDTGSPTPKQYRPEPPSRQPAIAASGPATASRLSATVNAASRLSLGAAPAGSTGLVQSAVGGHGTASAAPGPVPGLETPAPVGRIIQQAPPAGSHMPAASQPRKAATVLPPAAASQPVTVEPPGLQGGSSPSRASPVPSRAAISPGRAPMQRAAADPPQPSSQPLMPPSWRPPGQPPSQQQQQQLPPSRPMVSALHNGNGIPSPAGQGSGGGVVHHLQHGQQQQHQAATPSRPPPAQQHQQPSTGLAARVAPQAAAQLPGPAAMSRPGIRPVELPPDVLRPLNQQQVSPEASTSGSLSFSALLACVRSLTGKHVPRPHWAGLAFVASCIIIAAFCDAKNMLLWWVQILLTVLTIS